ncbi:unnamed protein product [Pieris brassicae]|uniref:Uncharacterized protein n=1 Tax=Pieris brassicae TaxID=7116 RepID=A0A9P0X679_PIEBR|nr:unnamed protein product [Pieris brassicae]
MEYNKSLAAFNALLKYTCIPRRTKNVLGTIVVTRVCAPSDCQNRRTPRCAGNEASVDLGQYVGAHATPAFRLELARFYSQVRNAPVYRAPRLLPDSCFLSGD